MPLVQSPAAAVPILEHESHERRSRDLVWFSVVKRRPRAVVTHPSGFKQCIYQLFQPRSSSQIVAGCIFKGKLLLM